FGVSSLAMPALLADRYGTGDFATIAGVLSIPIILTQAGAPLGAAAVHSAVGYTPVLIAVGGACLVAALGISTGTTLPFRVPVVPPDRPA
ncbi:MAG: hypothetical protein ACJ786_28895, partial [Catenulispora sp.]